MKQIHQGLIAAVFLSLMSVQSFALAPVVDDSENFAILDNEPADMNQSGQSVANNDYNDESSQNRTLDDEKPLAHEDPQAAGSQQPSYAKNPDQNEAQWLDKIQGLQQDVQELRGQLETQSHELKLLKDQQLAYYKDLDTRLSQKLVAPSAQNISRPTLSIQAPNVTPTAPLAINQAAPKANPVATPALSVISNPASNTRHNPADEQISYMAAYELVKNKQFDKALDAMQTFVNQYPNGAYTANAQYWLGELYMTKANYPEAIGHFDWVYTQYPNSNKAAASLLKIAYALSASGKNAEAKQKLNQVIKNYPDSPTAQLAQSKLQALNAS